MKKLFLLKCMLLLCALVAGSGSAWAAVTWTRVTSIQTLLDGGTFIMGYEATANSGTIVPLRTNGANATTSANGYFYSGTGTGTTSNGGTLSMGTLGNGGANYEVYITASKTVEGAINIQLGDASGNYIGNPNSKNTAKLYTTASANTAYTPTIGTNDVVTLTCSAASSYPTFQYNSSSPRYANYNKTQKNVVFYKKTLSTPSLSFSPTSLTATIGQSFSLPTLTSDAESGTVSYSSSDETVATVDSSTGALTLLKAGTTTITATAAATSTQNTASASYTLTVNASSVVAPSIDKASGDYAYNTAVTITTTEEDIMYTTDGTDPYSSSTAIDADGKTATVYITRDMTLTAISLDGDLNASAPVTCEYTVTKPAAPAFSLAEGSYVGSQTVTITSAAGTTIYYTTDGSDPDNGTDAEGNSVNVEVDATATIRAIAVDNNAISSIEATATYTIITAKTLPYSETFMTSSGLAEFTTDDATVWKANTSFGAVAQSGTATAWLISPVVSLVGAKGAMVNFSQATNGVGNTATDATVWVREFGGSWVQLTPLSYSDNSSWTYVDNSIDLADYLNKNIQIGFKYSGTATGGKWEVKDFSIVEVLPAPTFTLSSTAETLSMGTKETVGITLTTNTDGAVTCESDDEDVATVALKSAGVYTITAKMAGTAAITISAAASTTYRAASATVDVTVVDNREDAPVSFAETSQETTLGETYTGQVLTNANSLPVTYSSTDESVATVASDGTVTVHAAGETTIKATFAGNATYKKAIVSYTLTVNKKEAEIAWSADATEAKLGRTFVAPTLSNPNGLDVTYGSSWEYVAEIDAEGNVSIKNEGTCNITATFAGDDEYKASAVSYTLTVVDPQKVTVDFTKNSFGVSGDVQEDNQVYTTGVVTFTLNKGTSSYEPKVTKTLFQFYAKNTMTIEASSNYKISKVVFTKSSGDGDFSADNGTYTKSSLTWSGLSSSVTITNKATAQTKLTKIVVTLVEPANVTIGESGYATYCSTNALDFSASDVKAYTAKVESGKVVLSKVANDVVPANTGVVLYCETADTYTIPVTTTDATVSDNEMVGVTEATAVEWNVGTKYNYILQSGAFNMANGGKLRANRAYLSTAYDVTAASGARSLMMVFDDETTGIGASLMNSEKANGEVYNLNGQRVMNPVKGLYIVNGRKVVVK